MGHQTSFQGAPLELEGKELRAGDSLPAFRLTGTNMQDVQTSDFKGKCLVVSAVPSLDTPVCAIETKRLNEEVTKLGPDVAVLTVSMDLPFAQKRWCGAEGVENVTTASDYKYRQFGSAFGALIPSWGLLARAIFVADAQGKIVHAEYVSKVESEPDYDAVIAAAKKAAGR